MHHDHMTPTTDPAPIACTLSGADYRTRVAANLLTRFHAEVSGQRAASVWSHAS